MPGVQSRSAASFPIHYLALFAVYFCTVLSNVQGVMFLPETRFLIVEQYVVPHENSPHAPTLMPMHTSVEVLVYVR